MGCVSSKQARRDAISSPDSSAAAVPPRKGSGKRRAQMGLSQSKVGFGGLEKIREESEEGEDEHSSPSRKDSQNPKAVKKGNPVKKAAFSIKFGRLTEAEHLAAGWPGWLSAVAGEAVEGWLPLRSDKFQRLEKVLHKSLYGICVSVILI